MLHGATCVLPFTRTSSAKTRLQLPPRARPASRAARVGVGVAVAVAVARRVEKVKAKAKAVVPGKALVVAKQARSRQQDVPGARHARWPGAA